MLVSNQVILQIESDQDQVGRVFGIQSSLTNAVLIWLLLLWVIYWCICSEVTQLYVYGGIGLVIIWSNWSFTAEIFIG